MLLLLTGDEVELNVSCDDSVPGKVEHYITLNSFRQKAPTAIKTCCPLQPRQIYQSHKIVFRE